MIYNHRVIESKLKECLNIFSVVGLTGPRQSGKSTLLLNVLKDYQYVTFDDFQILKLFKEDPEKFFRIYPDKIIFDEVQKVPNIFNYVKIAVDNDRGRVGKFVLTGSSQFSFIKELSDTLAGRIALMSLLPYQYSELPDKHKKNALVFGSYPEIVNKDYALYQTWYSSYIETYINRDVAVIANIGDLHHFRKLIVLLAAHATQLLNLSKLASQIGVDAKTIKRWISVLEASYIIFQIQPFYNNFGKRIVKAPKIFFYDTGLICYLLGIETINQLEKGPLCGSIFENFIVSEIMKKECHALSYGQLYYYRGSNLDEIDLIVDRKKHLDFIEIKYSETFDSRMISVIEKLKSPDDYGYLLYNGQKRPYVDNINIIPFEQYLK